MTPSLQVVDKLSAADSMAGLVRDSSQLRMLGVVQSPARPDRSRSAAGAAIPHGGGRIIQAAVPCPGQLPIQKLEIRVAGCQPQVPEEMGYLKAPTHLHINVVAVESQAVSVLRAAAAAAAGQSVIVINSLDEWEKQSGCSKWVLIHFTARGCGAASLSMAPVFADLAKSFPGVVFLKVDVAKLAPIASRYDIKVVPTFLFLKVQQG
jgi:thioredoxin 1